MRARIRFLVSILLLFLISCGNEAQKENYFKFEIPFYIEPFEQPEYNKATQAGVNLGRKLFYDASLSGSNKVSCATCHIQVLAFSDGKGLSSAGESGEKLMRTSPPLFNLGWMDELFWDGGAPNLEFVNTGPLQSHNEMNQNPQELIVELHELGYGKDFEEAFGSSEIGLSKVSYALSQFQRSLLSFNSKYDQVKRGERKFTRLEQDGYSIFKRKCAQCHTEGLFTDNGFHNNGIDSVWEEDTLFGILYGRKRITDQNEDLGKFKTPSLRNLAYTAPYMHDGRFLSLNEVLYHYSTGIKKSATLDSSLVTDGHYLNHDNIQALLSFLHTLNDSTFIHAKNFSRPN